MSVKYTVAEALSKAYSLEAEAKAQRNQILKMIDNLEKFAEDISDDKIEELKRYGIDISGLVSVDFEELRVNTSLQRDYVNLANTITDRIVEFVQHYAES